MVVSTIHLHELKKMLFPMRITLKSKLLNKILRFSKIGIPPKSSTLIWLSIVNQPTIGVPPFLPPCSTAPRTPRLPDRTRERLRPGNLQGPIFFEYYDTSSSESIAWQYEGFLKWGYPQDYRFRYWNCTILDDLGVHFSILVFNLVRAHEYLIWSGEEIA